MPIMLGKLIFTVAVTTAAASIALALGAIMALVEEADRRCQRDSKAA